MILIDTNVLVYAINADAPQHECSRAFLEGVRSRPDGGVLFPQVLLEFFAIVTDHRRVTAPLSPETAWTQVETLRATFPMLDKALPALDLLSATLAEAKLKGAEVFDAFLIAQMRACGVVRICTYNAKDFKGFRGIEARTPEEFLVEMR